VDDTVQEVYLRVYKSLESFDTNLPFKPWLTGITLRQVSEARRKRWKIMRLLDKLFSFRLADNPDIAESVAAQDLYEQVIKRVEKLSPKLREVILLRYVYDFSQEEVAHILAIPLGTVKSRLNSALVKLRGDNCLPSLVLANDKGGKSHGF